MCGGGVLFSTDKPESGIIPSGQIHSIRTFKIFLVKGSM